MTMKIQLEDFGRYRYAQTIRARRGGRLVPVPCRREKRQETVELGVAYARSEQVACPATQTA
jgi:hypothetical protein